MTPRFADAVDPILIHAFSLMERIDGGVEIAPAEEKRTLEGPTADFPATPKIGNWPSTLW